MTRRLHTVRLGACLTTIVLAFLPGRARAQTPDEEIAILRLEATPIGALPPIALPMPASRNHNYWGVRAQAGRRIGRGGADLLALAGGIDFQYRGGSVFGVTAGYQERDCEATVDCGGHGLFGARGRFNVVTGGPTIGAVLGDYSATSTIGAELGLGFAPDVLPDVHACTLDIGMPLSVAMLQRVRLVTYLTPSVIWEIDCSKSGPPTRTHFATGAGIGVQQLGLRGLDVYLGLQRIFRSGTGYQFGLSVSYVRLP